MPSIYFDRDTYNAGETATITYVDAPANSLAAVRREGLGHQWHTVNIRRRGLV